MQKDKIMDSLKIKGMSCQHCVGSVKKALEALEGITDVTVNLEAGEATFANNGVSRDVVKKAVSKIGFEPVD